MISIFKDWLLDMIAWNEATDPFEEDNICYECEEGYIIEEGDVRYCTNCGFYEVY